MISRSAPRQRASFMSPLHAFTERATLGNAMNGTEDSQLFPAPLVTAAAELIDNLRSRRATLATAESCTGGLLSALITSIAGSSDVFGFGFVTYSNTAKSEMLSVTPLLLEQLGAVSPEAAAAMAEGARLHAQSTLAVSITGIAGPGGGSSLKPVGLVYLAVATVHKPVATHELRLGDIGRIAIRLKSTEFAIARVLDACRNLS